MSQLKCVLCKEYLFDGPVQCNCGHRLCTSCFQIVTKGKEEFICFECKEVVLVNQCFKDKAATALLKEAILQCPGPGCSWQGPGKDYLGHIAICNCVIVLCKMWEHGCKEELPRGDMEAHIAKCSFVPQKCQWCNSIVLDEKTHITEQCMSIPLDCANECGSIVPRNEMENHLKHECTHQIRKCEFSVVGCQYAGKAGELDMHNVINAVQHILLTNTFLRKLQKSFESRLTAVSKLVSEVKSEIHKGHEELTMKIKPLLSALSEVQTGIVNLKEGLSGVTFNVSRTLETTYDGIFIWRISEVQKLRRETLRGKRISICSCPFHTHKHGYIACLRLYFDGNGSGKSTHLSLFFALIKGTYDALLQWPFLHTVSLTLLDQGGDNHIVTGFQPEASSNSFQRPIDNMNEASGCPKFAPLSVLNKSYVVDDTMFVKCRVDIKQP